MASNGRQKGKLLDLLTHRETRRIISLIELNELWPFWILSQWLMRTVQLKPMCNVRRPRRTVIYTLGLIIQ